MGHKICNSLFISSILSFYYFTSFLVIWLYHIQSSFKGCRLHGKDDISVGFALCTFLHHIYISKIGVHHILHGERLLHFCIHRIFTSPTLYQFTHCIWHSKSVWSEINLNHDAFITNYFVQCMEKWYDWNYNKQEKYLEISYKI